MGMDLHVVLYIIHNTLYNSNSNLLGATVVILYMYIQPEVVYIKKRKIIPGWSKTCLGTVSLSLGATAMVVVAVCEVLCKYSYI
jgi:hypothetical protein